MTRHIHQPTLTLVSFLLALPVAVLTAAEDDARGKPWPIHVIDASSRGADGVRLADVNGDGLMDITTGWEEGGITRVYVHPGHQAGDCPDFREAKMGLSPSQAADKPWPAVTVGKTPSVEDAVFVDLDANGQIDVVTCCEGGIRTMFVHWAPQRPEDYLDPAAWKTEPIPASQNTMMWMFCAPAQIDGRAGVDLVAAGKGGDAQIGWFEAPEDPRRLDRWRWHPISPAGWIMSLRVADFNGDGNPDVITSDRRGALRGCRWLEHPGPGKESSRPWTNHFIGGREHEAMFMTVADLDAEGTDDVLVAVKPQSLLWFGRTAAGQDGWESHTIRMPENTGTGKGVAVGDIDLDGRQDVVFSCEHATGERSGVMWLSYERSPEETIWRAHEISGPSGIKFDRIELLDVDGDGDLDVLSCEESQPVAGSRRGLGVFWYENPCSGRATEATRRP